VEGSIVPHRAGRPTADPEPQEEVGRCWIVAGQRREGLTQQRGTGPMTIEKERRDAIEQEVASGRLGSDRKRHRPSDLADVAGGLPTGSEASRATSRRKRVKESGAREPDVKWLKRESSLDENRRGAVRFAARRTDRSLQSVGHPALKRFSDVGSGSIEELLRLTRCTADEMGRSGRQRPLGPSWAVGCELGRSGQEGAGGREAPASTGPLGSVLQVGGNRFVRACGCRSKVPCPVVRVARSVGHCGQRGMGAPSISSRSSAVDRGPNERVPKAWLGPQGKSSTRIGCVDRLSGDSELRGGIDDNLDIAAGLGRRHQ
jgi:hypothetical protein